MKSTSWFVYMLRCVDGTLYTGTTTDVTRRVYEHNHASKGARYTRGRRPVELVYSEKAKTRGHAQARESQLKKLSRAEKAGLIK